MGVSEVWRLHAEDVAKYRPSIAVMPRWRAGVPAGTFLIQPSILEQVLCSLYRKPSIGYLLTRLPVFAHFCQATAKYIRSSTGIASPERTACTSAFWYALLRVQAPSATAHALILLPAGCTSGHLKHLADIISD